MTNICHELRPDPLFCFGCGKSNVLEVLAAIFYQLEGQYLNYRPEALIPPDDNGPSNEN
ncbi:MAG: hypothetical protein V2B20_13915 [Pseudomonadota bacterium]